MEDKFIAMLKEVLEIEDRELDITDVFRDYDEWDSLAQLTLIASMDENFDVAIETPEFNKLITVGDLIAAVKAKS